MGRKGHQSLHYLGSSQLILRSTHIHCIAGARSLDFETVLSSIPGSPCSLPLYHRRAVICDQSCTRSKRLDQ